MSTSNGLKGLTPKFDWANFTLKNRVLDNEVPYEKIAEGWQTEIDAAIANHQCIYLQLPRGHDKTDRFAWWSLLWLSSTAAARGYCAGVDRDNAALFRDSSKKLKALHPHLFASIDVQKDTVLNKDTGSYIQTISSDADSAYGLNFDLLIINDFHAWPDEKFWTVLYTACGKKPGIRIWMESNALTLGSEGAEWVSRFRDDIQFNDKLEKNPLTPGYNRWYYFRPSGFLATWQFPMLEKWRRVLHPSEFNRLILNEDGSGEESYLTQEQVTAITTLKGPSNGWAERNKRPGHTVTAVDIGLKKDATAIATVHSIPVPGGRAPSLELLALDVLVGSTHDPVSESAILSVMEAHYKKYHAKHELMDPWNAAFIIQSRPRAIEWPFTAKHILELTQILYRVIAEKQLRIYPNAGKAVHTRGTTLKETGGHRDEWDLQKELINAVLKDMSYGKRIDHKVSGYSDRMIAVGMAVHYLMSGEISLPHHIIKQEKVIPENQLMLTVSKEVAEWVSEFDSKNKKEKPLFLGAR